MSLTRFSGPVKSTNGFRVGSSAVDMTLVMKGTVTIDPASLAAVTTSDNEVTITGVLAGDVVLMNPPATLDAGIVYGGCYISASDTVQVRIGNITAGAIDVASSDWTYAVFRFASN